MAEMTRDEIAEMVAAEVAKALEAKPVQQLYRAATVAKMLDVTKTTVWRWAAEGILPPAIKLGGGCTVFDAAALHEFIDGKKMEMCNV